VATPSNVFINQMIRTIETAMKTHLAKFATLLSLTAIALVISLSVKAAAVEAELSKVTLFVEGMMKSRGGVT